jgi:hypothetical protein
MYAREFAAGVLDGFEDSIEVLLKGADQETRSELLALSNRLQAARTRIDPEWCPAEMRESDRRPSETARGSRAIHSEAAASASRGDRNEQ